jgi:hypothetical protein
MQISISKFTGFVTGVVSLLLIGGLGYLSFTLFFQGDAIIDTPDIKTINVGILGPKTQKAASALVNAADKIALKKKDLMFLDSNLYHSFVDFPDDVPTSTSRGRPDPFLPYAAP